MDNDNQNIFQRIAADPMIKKMTIYYVNGKSLALSKSVWDLQNAEIQRDDPYTGARAAIINKLDGKGILKIHLVHVLYMEGELEP